MSASRALRSVEARLDGAASRRIWQGVQARRRRRDRVARSWALSGAFALGVAAALAVVKVHRAPAVDRSVARSDEGAGALMLGSGAPWGEVLASPSESSTLDLADGSRVVLAAGGALWPLENTGRSIVLLLASGSADFDVRPGGPRRWSIEAGLATVEVVGTSFSVRRSDAELVVEVRHGTVLVRGERVRDRVQRLSAGEGLVVTAKEEPAPLASAAPAEPRAERVREERSLPAWRKLAGQGEYAKAYEDLGANGIAARAATADVEQLLALADVARLSGHPADAVEPLARVVSRHRTDPRAALAAFTLGRVHLDSLADAPAAANDFATALAVGLPPALLEDAYLRLVEARARAGDRAGTEQACREHHRRFPNSPRASKLARFGCAP
jgi:transmembrane sensor